MGKTETGEYDDHQNCNDSNPYERVPMEPVSTRISEEDAALLSELEEEMNTNRETVLRNLIREGLANWKRKRALERLREREITLRTAAEIADVSYVEMCSLAAEQGIDAGYTNADLERDLERI